MRFSIPQGYALHLIDTAGRVTSTAGSLTPDEVEAMRHVRSGDSREFGGDHAMRFVELRDGSILALTIPWDAYRNIPLQVTLYTLSVMLLTTLAFVASLVSYFVSGTAGFLMLLYAPVHMYWQLRGTYELRRFSAFWRMLALSVFAWWAITIFAGLLVLMAE
jgi:hypothetical protein